MKDHISRAILTLIYLIMVYASDHFFGYRHTDLAVYAIVMALLVVPVKPSEK